jgi:hypothetical protein
LERALTAGKDPVPELEQLGDPWDLHLLLYLQLCRAVKMGPPSEQHGDIAPLSLLSIAQRAAECGVVPCATPHAMRQVLAQAELEVRRLGAWRDEVPLWWQPLPPPTPLERIWSDWQENQDGPLSLPTEQQLQDAFRVDRPPRWLPLDAVVDRPTVCQLCLELETAHAQGRIRLQRGRVGSRGQLSPGRTDWVTYLAGTEGAWLTAAPTFAAFVQWCLSHLSDGLAGAMPGRRLAAPERVMLARYPAPSAGFAAHLDNVGGEHDNGRALAIVLYLNSPQRACIGGELLIWEVGTSTAGPPTAALPPAGGSGVVFDARQILHQVQPVREGPARWAIVIWLSDAHEPVPQPTLPALTATDVLLPVADPPLDRDIMLLHRLDDDASTGRIDARRVPAAPLRMGIVSTVFRGGADLDRWCAHHFSLGIDHIVLAFDHLEEPQEATDAARLRAIYPPARLTIWSGQDLMCSGWHGLDLNGDLAGLKHLAAAGSSSAAVSARQMLNATAALCAAQEGRLGEEGPLDWLLHLDCDELFYLQGAARGGTTLAEHLAVAQAAGLRLIRYVNHELLLPHSTGTSPRFKVNPTLAAAHLGPVGWSETVHALQMSQFDARPYFAGYLNGKSAVAVRAGSRAAGVHSWALDGPHSTAHSAFLAGPCVLHFHFATPGAFRQKYLAIAADPLPLEERPFAPSPAEVAALEAIHSLQEAAAGPADIARRLDALYDRLTSFSEVAIEVLEEAGLLVRPDLKQPLYIES